MNFKHFPSFMVVGLIFVGVLLPGCAARTIFEAARNGNYQQVKAMVEDDPTLTNARDQHKWTPLHHAADQGHKDVVELLLEHGADPESAANSGWTVLKTVKKRDYRSIEKVLLKAIEQKKRGE